VSRYLCERILNIQSATLGSGSSLFPQKWKNRTRTSTVHYPRSSNCLWNPRSDCQASEKWWQHSVISEIFWEWPLKNERSSNHDNMTREFWHNRGNSTKSTSDWVASDVQETFSNSCKILGKWNPKFAPRLHRATLTCES
jgi:hypothetical protein